MANLDDEPDDYVYYGDALTPLEEDDMASKKPIRIEDQEVRDEHGRRRFHGAFTGGFSAGYYNTVDTKEGWRPSEFKSSRGDRQKKEQRPEDYMDQEDLSVFGIAPQVLRAKDEFGENQISRKQTRPLFASRGPIPGIPALHDLFRPVKETIGIKLLRAMGWKPHQGVGERQTKKQKKERKKQIERLKTYTVGLPPGHKQPGSSDGEDDDEDEDSQHLFAPDDAPVYVAQPKTNTFGMGYSGLMPRDAGPAAAGSRSGFLLFEPTLSITDKKKKLQIAGQAFGVGAFEKEDADIYAKDDMSQYDFELGGPKVKKPASNLLALPCSDLLEGFVRATKPEPIPKIFPPPVVPRDFNPIHRIGKSRFDLKPMTEAELKGLGRHALDANQRAAILNEVLDMPASSQSHAEAYAAIPQEQEPPAVETPTAQPTPAEVVAKALAEIRERMAVQQQGKAPAVPADKKPPAAIPSAVDPDREAKIASLKAFVQQNLPAASNFRPFARDPDKQARFDAFSVLSKVGRLDEFRLLQPSSMTEWEMDHEKSEFERSMTLYQPLTGKMQNRFTSGGHVEENIQGGLVAQLEAASLFKLTTGEELPKIKKEPVEKDPLKRAAKRKQFGPLTRNREVWKPDRLLCIRFNVPNPFPDKGSAAQNASTKFNKGSANKFSIFDVLTNNAGPSFQSAGPENVTGPVEGPAPLPVKAQELEWDKAERGQLEEKSGDLLESTQADGTAEGSSGAPAVEEEEEAPRVRPSMDVFKAIFAETDSEEEEEEEDEPEEAKTPKVKAETPKEKEEEDMDEDAYGPRLPTAAKFPPASSAPAQALALPTSSRNEPDEEWVEASEKSKKSKKRKEEKKKKKKKEKSKKKKRRHSSSSSSSSSEDADAKILRKIAALKKQRKL